MMEQRLIDANALAELLKDERDFYKKMCDNMQQPCEQDERAIIGAYYTAYSKSYHIVKDAPTVDAVSVRHGYNKQFEFPSQFTCSVCGWESWGTYCGDTDTFNYCPNCGAKMDGERKDIELPIKQMYCRGEIVADELQADGTLIKRTGTIEELNRRIK